MIMKRISRWSSRATIAGGGLLGLNVAANALTDYTRIHSEIHALSLATVLPLLIALVGLHIRYANRSGLLGRFALLVTFCSLVAWAIGSFSVALFAAALDIDSMAEIGFALNTYGMVGISLGTALTGLALARAGLITRLSAGFLILGASLLFIFSQIPVTAFLAYGPPTVYSYLVALSFIGPFGLAWAWLGYSLRSSTTALQTPGVVPSKLGR